MAVPCYVQKKIGKIGSQRQNSKQPPLPIDVILCILEELHQDFPILLSLCLLNTGWLDLVLPLIYRKVRLSAPNAINVFCTTVLKSSRTPGAYTSSLYIDFSGSIPQHLNHLTATIHKTLQRTPNLTHLALPRLRLPVRLPRIFLPNLTSIHANPLTIQALVPGRPVSSINSGSTLLFGVTTRLFCETLKASNAFEGVQEVAVSIPKTQLWTGATDLITKLSGVCGTSLKRLKLTMLNLKVSASDLSSYILSIEALIAPLNKFTRLESFQLNGEPVDIPANILLKKLGTSGTLTYWKGNTTLRDVILFGVKLS